MIKIIKISGLASDITQGQGGIKFEGINYRPYGTWPDPNENKSDKESSTLKEGIFSTNTGESHSVTPDEKNRLKNR